MTCQVYSDTEGTEEIGGIFGIEIGLLAVQSLRTGRWCMLIRWSVFWEMMNNGGEQVDWIFELGHLMTLRSLIGFLLIFGEEISMYYVSHQVDISR